jgi:hypothetical protein
VIELRNITGVLASNLCTAMKFVPHSLPFELKQETWLANFGVIAMRNYLAAISDLSYMTTPHQSWPARPAVNLQMG